MVSGQLVLRNPLGLIRDQISIIIENSSENSFIHEGQQTEAVVLGARLHFKLELNMVMCTSLHMVRHEGVMEERS